METVFLTALQICSPFEKMVKIEQSVSILVATAATASGSVLKG